MGGFVSETGISRQRQRRYCSYPERVGKPPYDFGHFAGRLIIWLSAAEQMVVFSYVCGSCFVVRMDNTVHVVQKPEAVRFIAPVPINLSVDRDHQMEDSSHCWGIFVDGGHFRIDRFRKD